MLEWTVNVIDHEAGEIIRLVASVHLCLWKLHCAPLRWYRAKLCTIDLHCAPPTCIVHYGPQEVPTFLSSRGDPRHVILCQLCMLILIWATWQNILAYGVTSWRRVTSQNDVSDVTKWRHDVTKWRHGVSDVTKDVVASVTSQNDIMTSSNVSRAKQLWNMHRRRISTDTKWRHDVTKWHHGVSDVTNDVMTSVTLQNDVMTSSNVSRAKQLYEIYTGGASTLGLSIMHKICTIYIYFRRICKCVGLLVRHNLCFPCRWLYISLGRKYLRLAAAKWLTFIKSLKRVRSASPSITVSWY